MITEVDAIAQTKAAERCDGWGGGKEQRWRGIDTN